MVFDFFTINGSLVKSKGTYISNTGVTLPTGKQRVYIPLKEVAEVLAREYDGVNTAEHCASFHIEGAWKGVVLTRFNIAKFLRDFAEGRVMTKVKIKLTPENKTGLLKLALEYAKFDPTFNREVAKPTTKNVEKNVNQGGQTNPKQNFEKKVEHREERKEEKK